MIPILQKNVHLLKKTHLKEPKHKMPYNHVVALPEGADRDTVIAQRGILSRLSAEVGSFAFIMAVAERIQAGATDDELKALESNGSQNDDPLPDCKASRQRVCSHQ